MQGAFSRRLVERLVKSDYEEKMQTAYSSGSDED
jgi:hypothetical protein